MPIIIRNSAAFCALVLLMAGCSDRSSSRYNMSKDAYPNRPPNISWIENAYPRIEPLSRSGNKDYKVNGHTYKIWRGIQSYQQVGMASWYGLKFQGHKTANGEIYDMYSMSAAHKNLPLPSYVRVTNLSNHRSVIVRVNDRGPFHSNRIIDLSYAAAYKLGMLASGTAKVRITLIIPGQHQLSGKVALKPPLPVQTIEYYVQLLALKDTAAASKQQQLLAKQGYSAVIVPSRKWTIIRLGPYVDHHLAEQAKRKMRQGRYKDAFIVPIKHTD